jgi:hypothetical protein
MRDAILQKILKLTDEQVQALRQAQADWSPTQDCFIPSSMPLLELIRQTIVDRIGEDEEAAVEWHDADECETEADAA